jgi:hypothetical protein
MRQCSVKLVIPAANFWLLRRKRSEEFSAKMTRELSMHTGNFINIAVPSVDEGQTTA